MKNTILLLLFCEVCGDDQLFSLSGLRQDTKGEFLHLPGKLVY